LLCERVFTGEKAGKRYVNCPVEQVLEEQPLLQTTKMAKDELLTLEKRILATHKAMIGAHMLGHHTKLTRGSKFLRSLSKLRVGGNLKDSDVLWWTEAAEEQVQQHPWGGSRSDHAGLEDRSELEQPAPDGDKDTEYSHVVNASEKGSEKKSGAKRRRLDAGTSTPTKDDREQAPSSTELSETKRKRRRRILPGSSSLNGGINGPSTDNGVALKEVKTKTEEHLSEGQNVAVHAEEQPNCGGDTEQSRNTGATCTVM